MSESDPTATIEQSPPPAGDAAAASSPPAATENAGASPAAGSTPAADDGRQLKTLLEKAREVIRAKLNAIGRTVLYCLPVDSENAGELRPATIVGVIDADAGRVSLNVQCNTIQDFMGTRLQQAHDFPLSAVFHVHEAQFDREADAGNDKPFPGAWHWPTPPSGNIPAN